MVKKQLVKELGTEDKVSIFLVNNSYFSVEYREKEEYYTKNRDIAFLVGKTILSFFENYKRGVRLLQDSEGSEEGWVNLVRYLRAESRNSEESYEIAMGVYRSLEKLYSNMNIEDKNIARLRTQVQMKDLLTFVTIKLAYLFEVENKLTESFDNSEAQKNALRYKRVRDHFVSQRKELSLKILGS